MTLLTRWSVRSLFSAGFGTLALLDFAAILAAAPAASAATPYKIVNTAQFLGTGAIDYVYADNDERRLYIPRGNQVLVFDMDTLLRLPGAFPDLRFILIPSPAETSPRECWAVTYRLKSS